MTGERRRYHSPRAGEATGLIADLSVSEDFPLIGQRAALEDVYQQAIEDLDRIKKEKEASGECGDG